MPDAARVFIDAKKAHVEAVKNAGTIIGHYRRLSCLFKGEWDQIAIIGVDGRYPAKTIDNPRTQKIPVDLKLPTIREIHEALVECHKTEATLFDAWRAMPKEDQANFNDPTTPLHRVQLGTT